MNWIQFVILVILLILSVLFIASGFLWLQVCKFQNAKMLVDHYFERKEQHYHNLIKIGLDVSKYN